MSDDGLRLSPPDPDRPGTAASQGEPTVTHPLAHRLTADAPDWARRPLRAWDRDALARREPFHHRHHMVGGRRHRSARARRHRPPRLCRPVLRRAARARQAHARQSHARGRKPRLLHRPRPEAADHGLCRLRRWPAVHRRRRQPSQRHRQLPAACCHSIVPLTACAASRSAAIATMRPPPRPSPSWRPLLPSAACRSTPSPPGASSPARMSPAGRTRPSHHSSPCSTRAATASCSRRSRPPSAPPRFVAAPHLAAALGRPAAPRPAPPCRPPAP